MPNYKIPTKVREDMKKRAGMLAQRTLAYALSDFPLTLDQIQDIVLAPAHYATMCQLEADGICTISRFNELRFTFMRDVLPIRRGAVIRLHIPRPGVFVPKATNYSIHSDKPFDVGSGHYLIPDPSRLNSETQQSLVTWIDRVVRQQRMVEITNYVTKEIIENYIPTTSHVHALWPSLMTLVTDREWVSRFRNPTRSLRAYAPASSLLVKFSNLMQVADIVFSSGDILDDLTYDQEDPRAFIEHWEPLDGDKTY